MVKTEHHGPKLLHFLNRTRSTKNYYMGFDPCLPGIRSPHSRFNQNQPCFPQPSRPWNSYNSLSPKPPCTPPYRSLPNQAWEVPSTTGITQSPNRPANINYNIDYPYYVPESWFQQYNKNQDVTDQLEESDQLGEGHEEIVTRILEFYEKLPERVREKVSLELMRNSVRIGGSSATGEKGLISAGSSTTSTRGLNREESSGRLERFKIKTINVGGVVKTDEEKN